MSQTWPPAGMDAFMRVVGKVPKSWLVPDVVMQVSEERSANCEGGRMLPNIVFVKDPKLASFSVH